MIRLSDATLLAFAKLRTRKVRTIITILLASLLFGVLVAGSLITNGAFSSVDNFSKDGLTSRYIVSVNNAVINTSSTSVLRDPALILEAKKLYETLVEKKISEAKRLGLSYSQASDQPPYIVTPDGAERLYPNDRNGIVQSLLNEKYGGQTYIDDTKLASITKTYGATKLFTVDNFSILRGASLNVLPDGKEVFYDTSDDAELNANYTTPIIDSSFPIAPSDLTASFMLPNNAGWLASSGTLPIVVPQNVAEQLMGMDSIEASVTAEQKLERIRDVREKAAGFTFQACYRNEASISLIQQTITQQKEIKAHSGDTEYVVPNVVYELPDATECASPVISSDTRTAAQKTQDNNQEIFDKEFGLYNDPESYFVSFKIVGISPAQSDDQPNRSVSDVVNDLLKTSGIGQMIPKDLYDKIPDKSKYADILAFEPYYLLGNEDNKTRYVEFSNATDAQKFIDEQSCTTQMDGTCKPAGRDYMATLAFSDSVALNDIRSRVSDWFGFAVLGVAILAAIVMWITIGRTIADGRRETAVFRAIGFKRIDISLVYIIYTVVLSILSAALAGAIGLAAALTVDKMYAQHLTVQAQYAFGGLDLTKEFSLVGFNTEQLAIILVASLGAGILSMIIPLIRNVRRSPIKDMRDDG
ncbi:ABC transporter permease [Candidatus Saccharibacteria bacterium]|nr:ABC transporter permease [Candidatus Saccharibacteria bacterium]